MDGPHFHRQFRPRIGSSDRDSGPRPRDRHGRSCMRAPRPTRHAVRPPVTTTAGAVSVTYLSATADNRLVSTLEVTDTEDNASVALAAIQRMFEEAMTRIDGLSRASVEPSADAAAPHHGEVAIRPREGATAELPRQGT